MKTLQIIIEIALAWCLLGFLAYLIELVKKEPNKTPAGPQWYRWLPGGLAVFVLEVLMLIFPPFPVDPKDDI